LFYAATTLPLFSAKARRAATDDMHGLERDLKHWNI